MAAEKQPLQLQYDLMSHAETDADLRRLLAKIDFRNLRQYPGPSSPHNRPPLLAMACCGALIVVSLYGCFALGDCGKDVRGTGHYLLGDALLVASWCCLWIGVPLGAIGLIGLIVGHIAVPRNDDR